MRVIEPLRVPLAGLMAGRVTPWASTPFSRTLIRLRRVPVGICGVSVRSAATGLATSEVLVTVTV